MALPILHSKHPSSDEDLVRLFHQTERRWCQHLGQEDALEVGTAYSNPDLASVFNANNIRDVALPAGVSPEAAFEMVAAHFAARKTACAYWVMNPSVPASQTREMVEYLTVRGYRPELADIMTVRRLPEGRIAEAGGLKIIPARASYRHARQLFEEKARAWKTPALAEASLLHLDDPHWDAILAMKDGAPVGYAGVLVMGEVGRIDQVYVAEAFRGLGIGRTIMGRVMEICSRSLLKYVMLSVLSDNAIAVQLYKEIGFERIGQIAAYLAEGARA